MLNTSSTVLRFPATVAPEIVRPLPGRRNDGPIGVITNPRSHRNRNAPPECRQLEHVTVATPMTKDALTQALTRFADSGIDTLIIKGGDGTVRDVLTYGGPIFGDNWPRLMMVPRGKTNALAIDLGLPADWSFDAIMAAIEQGNTLVRHPIVIERDWHEPALWGFIFGAGAFNAAIDTGQLAHRFGAFQGAAIGITAAMGLAKAVFGVGSGPWRDSALMRIRGDVDGIELPHSGRGGIDSRYLALFSTLRRFPIGLAPFREADSDIRFLLLDYSIRRVTARLPMILTGVEAPFYPELGIHRGAGKGFRFDLSDRFTLDGETFGPGRLVMREGPALEFIVP
jgi:diacylglycerol kinase (ATP)